MPASCASRRRFNAVFARGLRPAAEWDPRQQKGPGEPGPSAAL